MEGAVAVKGEHEVAVWRLPVSPRGASPRMLPGHPSWADLILQKCTGWGRAGSPGPQALSHGILSASVQLAGCAQPAPRGSLWERRYGSCFSSQTCCSVGRILTTH